jgi:hypothetical protein
MDDIELYIETIINSLNEKWSDEDKEVGFAKGYLMALKDTLNKIKRMKDDLQENK